MHLIRGLHNLRECHRGAVVTIGNFDGVHRGHQAILSALIESGRQLHLPSVAMIFEPQPAEFFLGDRAPARLTHLHDKLAALRDCGVDKVLCVRFNDRFRALTADAFVQEILVRGLSCRHLVIGDDFRFGCDRSGDFHYLHEAGRRFGFSVVDTPTVFDDGERVSSTRLRNAIDQADFAIVERLLGRPYSISGRVTHGDKLGRTIGVPTANIPLKRQVSPLRGVYAVRVQGAGASSLYGVANVGRRPTVGGSNTRLEVHLFDFAADIYSRRLKVEFLHKIRDEQRFASLDELKQAIAADMRVARDFFADQKAPGASVIE